MTYSRLAIALVLSVTVLAACGTEDDTKAVDPAASGEPSSTAAPTPVPEGPVRTHGLVTVLDSGDGPELCLGAVAESYPPQCGGPRLEDFEWGDVGAEEASGVRWGSYALTGTYDGTVFTVSDAIPAALYDAVAEPDDARVDGRTMNCSVPGGTGDKTSPEDMDATLAAASALPGYAGAWLSDDTINVAVTEDEDGAAESLRQLWGGSLCLTTVEKTEADLNAINLELQTSLGEQLLTSGSTLPDSLDAQVIFDDGSIQDWADATWGDGLVRISSALEPAE